MEHELDRAYHAKIEAIKLEYQARKNAAMVHRQTMSRTMDGVIAAGNADVSSKFNDIYNDQIDIAMRARDIFIASKSAVGMTTEDLKKAEEVKQDLMYSQQMRRAFKNREFGTIQFPRPNSNSGDIFSGIMNNN